METSESNFWRASSYIVETEQSRSSGWRLRALRAHAWQFGCAKLLSQPRLAPACSCRRQLPGHRQVAHNPRSSGWKLHEHLTVNLDRVGLVETEQSRSSGWKPNCRQLIESKPPQRKVETEQSRSSGWKPRPGPCSRTFRIVETEQSRSSGWKPLSARCNRLAC